MHLLTAAEMRECDRRTIEDLGVPGPVLMERAGSGIAWTLRRRFPDLARRRVWIVCGKGNNGGDGLVVARHLHDLGLNPRILLTDPPAEITGDAARQIPPLLDRRIPLETMSSRDRASIERLDSGDILVDAILGTGFKGAVTEPKAEVIESINRSAAFVVSVDIPSGLSADSGTVAGPAVRAGLTVTMAFPKRSFLFWPAREHVGEWVVVDIGIPNEVVETVRPVARLLTHEDTLARIAPLQRNAHKGARGKLLIAGGSPGLTGAPCLAARGAARAGAGLVRIVVPRSLNPIIEAKLTEPMSFPAPETDAGTLAAKARDFVLSLREGWDALVLGPGLGRHPESERLARDILEGWQGPLLVDADALNALAEEGMPEISPIRPAPVFTPHYGEMARLAGVPLPEVAGAPIDTARRFAQRHGLVVVLKGAPTIISDPTGRVLVNTTGNPCLATGGSGDVLSGIIGAFLAQGVDPYWAAGWGVYLHGLAADLLVSKRAERSIGPGEVADAIGEVLVTRGKDSRRAP